SEALPALRQAGNYTSHTPPHSVRQAGRATRNPRMGAHSKITCAHQQTDTNTHILTLTATVCVSLTKYTGSQSLCHTHMIHTHTLAATVSVTHTRYTHIHCQSSLSVPHND